MGNRLIDPLPPARLAARGEVIEYTGVVDDFERLVEIIDNDLAGVPHSRQPRGWRQQRVEARLEFMTTGGGHAAPAVRGRASARIAGVCQRCLEPFVMPLETTFSIVFADESRADEFPDFEIWELEDGKIRPLDVVEETLVMALPLAPAHETKTSCGPLAKRLEAGTKDTARPFAGLRGQMEKDGE